MNVLADENIDRSIVARLRADGHDVLAVAEMEPGIPDDVVLARANERVALLITEDKDFGELVFRQGLVHAGVILLRLAGLAAAVKADLLANTLVTYPSQVTDSFCVLTRGSLRIRKRGPS